MKKILLLLLFISIMLCSGAFAGTSKSTLSGEMLEVQMLNRRAQLFCVLQRMFRIAPKINIEDKIPFVLQNMFEGELTSGDNERFYISDIRTERDFLLIEILGEIWDSANWVNDWKNTFSYDANGYMIEGLNQIWDGTSWLNSSLAFYSYDANGYMVEMLMKVWVSGSWENGMKMTITYNPDGSMNQLLLEMWMVDEWILYSRFTYSYDANGYMIEELTEAYDFISGTLVYDSKSMYTYDANGNHIEKITQDWENETWVNYERTTWQYDANNHETERIEQYWDGSAWANSARHTFTYDANGNMTEDLRELWEGGTWVDYNLYTYTYDAAGNMIQELYQMWDAGSWVNNELYTYTYDANGNLSQELWQYWEGGAWVNGERYTYTYTQTAVDDNQISQIEDNLLSFPNPFNSQTTISFNLPIRALVNLTIYNIKGQMVKTLISNCMLDRDDNHSYIWNGKNENGDTVKSGVYFYKLQCENKTIVKRILLMK